jgi:hypothetical protein
MSRALAMRAAPRSPPSRPAATAVRADRAAGSNQALQDLLARGRLRAKIEVGPVDDEFEREADALAERLTQAPEPAVRRKCAACANAERDETVRLKPAGPPSAAPAGAAAGLGRGAPLPATERAFFEPRLGRDLGDVRLHLDAAPAVRLGARAFALDREIAFAPGEWRPGTVETRRLLAHELTHVLQRDRGAPPALRRQTPPPPGQRTVCVGDVCFEETPEEPVRSPLGTAVGDVRRREYVRGDPTRVVHDDRIGVSFNPNASPCEMRVAHRIAFRQPPTGTFGSCEGPPAPGTAVPNIERSRFDRLKGEVLDIANDRLRDWYKIRLEGSACPGRCVGGDVPIRIDVSEDPNEPQSTLTPVNRAGRSYVSGQDIVLCMGSPGMEATIAHEAVHFVLRHGDEYREPDQATAAQAPRGQYSPEREIESDYSLAGSHSEHGRFAMLHERHFNFAPAFLERLYPGCRATLVAQPRPFLPSFRPTYSFGYVSIGGLGGVYQSLAFELGIPLDRLRRWELTVGPRAAMIYGSGDRQSRDALVLGLRLGFEYRTSPGKGGLHLGGFGELGYGRFSSTDYRTPGPSYAGSTTSLYGEAGLGASYRFGTGVRRPVVGLEGAVGGALGTGVIGPVTPEIERDPALTRYVRLGLTLGFEL